MQITNKALARNARNRSPAITSAPGSIFERLSDRPLPVRVYDSGVYIFFQGAVLKNLYIVKEGAVLLTRVSTDGREVIIGFVRAGESFGEVPLLNDGIALFNALAIQKTVLLIVQDTQFKGLLNDALVCRNLAQLMARHCHWAWAQVEALTGGQLRERICAMLSLLCKQIGIRTPCGIEINVTQQQLAHMVGTTRESLNRRIQALKEDNILKIKRAGRNSCLLILRPEKLVAEE